MKTLIFCCSFRKIKTKEGKVERDDAAGPTSNITTYHIWLRLALDHFIASSATLIPDGINIYTHHTLAYRTSRYISAMILT